MGAADWSTLSGSLGASDVVRGLTSGIDKPSGGGTYVFGFHALSSASGAVGLYTNLTNFGPIVGSGGGQLSAAIRRDGAGGTVFVYFAAVTAAVGAVAYKLGL